MKVTPVKTVYVALLLYVSRVLVAKLGQRIVHNLAFPMNHKMRMLMVMVVMIMYKVSRLSLICLMNQSCYDV